MAVNEQGKFTKKTEEVVKKIEEAACLDCTVDEICLYANISKQTYYNWINEDEKFKERVDELRNTPVLKARQVAVEKATESYQNAMDYLKRKRKLEFSERQEVTGKDGEPMFLPSELLEKNAIAYGTKGDSPRH